MSRAPECLKDLQQAVAWLRARVTGQLRTDSRLVQPGDGFIAWPGGVTDGRKHVASALERGAAACLVEQKGIEAFDLQGQVASFLGLKAATAEIAAQWCNHPSQYLQVLAVTGTNGKTSTAWWLAHALAQYRHGSRQGCAMVGTLGIGVPPHVVSTGLTTPDPVCLQYAFSEYVQQGIAACAIEASSIGIEEHRLDGTSIHTAVFTNFTQDHLDYHGSMGAYWQAKAKLFAWDGLKAAVVNVDDVHGAALAKDLLAQAKVDVWTVAVAAPARLQALNVRHGVRGLCFDVQEGADVFTLDTGLIGQYNVSNMLGVLATLRTLGMSLADAIKICADLEPVPGRMQQIVQVDQPLVVVDYAHTPDALEQALKGLQPVAQARGGKLHCIFGCGGNRDASKRPLMGQAAQRQADEVWVTSDNPRGEQPDAIVAQIVAGMQPQAVHVQVDRSQAIMQAIAQAHIQDVVLLAGKGHEDYQEIMGVKHPFSDMDKACAALAVRQGQKKVMMTLQQALAWISIDQPQARLVGDAATPLLRVHTDSRTLQKGDLFVALKGERMDANEFLPQVQAQGMAAAAVAHGGLEALGLAGIEVPDTTVALGSLAAGWRSQFGLPLIAVTGSNGKTTVTQMIASILKAFAGDAALATQGNFNNAIGVPFTLFRLHAQHRIGVVELGMNHPGEITELARMAQPSVALVNNAQREHQEFMHTVAAVAQENASVFAHLPQDGVAVFPADDEFTPLWRELAQDRQVLTFGSQQRADVTAVQAQWADSAWQVQVQTPQGHFDCALHIAGRHNVRNALAATACALAAGVSIAAIAQGLNAFVPVKGRSRSTSVLCAGRRVDVVDDTYNANPDSMQAAIAVLAELPGPRMLVVGDMGEVGDQGPAFHTEIGASARHAGIEQFLALGAQMKHAVAAFGAGAEHFEDMHTLIAAVQARMGKTGSVLVKGSRSMKMEQVVQALESGCKEGATCC